MAIRPPSDIVLDVARAADPLRYAEAKTRLHSLAGPAGGPGFDEVFGEVVRRPRRSFGSDPMGGATALRNATTLARPRDCGGGDPRASAAHRAFEAMALKTMVESMLPKDSEAVYGQGLSGDVWRSMLAEQVANQIAESGGVGIAERLAESDPDRRGGAVPRSVAGLADALSGTGVTRLAPAGIDEKGTRDG